MLKTYVTLQFRAQAATRALSARLRADDHEAGQTAAEYLGIIVVVAAIIAAIFGLHLETKIANGIGNAIDKITNGGS